MESERADTLDVGPCSECGRRNPADARFCNACGRRLHHTGTMEGQGLGAEDASPLVADPLVGRLVADRYRIVELVGRGGMGVVYKAEHVHIGKFVALKLLHGELGAHRSVARRFRREAEAASRLSSPHTVQIFDYGESDGLIYIAMEYIDGEDLGRLLERKGQIPYPRAARICAQIASAAAEAHAQGVVHRDLKPENVMVSPTLGHPDFVKVLDFGLAKLREEEADALTLTRAGHIVGTPYYMAPEQIRGEAVGPATDIYAIGAILYRCVAGVPPFTGNSPMNVLTKHLTERVLPLGLRLDGLPEHLDAIVLRALAKEPADRFASAEELRDELLALLTDVGAGLGPAAVQSRSGSPRPRTSLVRPPAVATRGDVDAFERKLRRRGRLGTFLFLGTLSALGLGGWLAWRHRPPPPPPRFEREPNDRPSQANPLPPDWPMEGYLGKRLSPTRSDADVYVVRRPSESVTHFDLSVTAIPNMDIVVDVVSEGSSTPMLVLDSTGKGGAERAAHLPILTKRYYLRVREKWIAGHPATENVSDPYTIQWTPRPSQPGWEREFDDTLENPSPLPRPGETVRGFIGWRGDVDIYCATQRTENARLELTPPPGLDLRIRLVDRVRGNSRVHDRPGAGATEHIPRVNLLEPKRHCVEVSVSPRSRAPHDPDHAYTLRIAPSEEPSP